MDRVTITLPRSLVNAIDRVDNNRSGFLARAARRELKRRERQALREALDARPWSAEDQQLTEGDLQAWSAALPDDDVSAMLDLNAGKAVRWVPGTGWIEGEEVVKLGAAGTDPPHESSRDR
jgi:hypothetical protein